jgi:hypothetical protein
VSQFSGSDPEEEMKMTLLMKNLSRHFPIIYVIYQKRYLAKSQMWTIMMEKSLKDIGVHHQALKFSNMNSIYKLMISPLGKINQ